MKQYCKNGIINALNMSTILFTLFLTFYKQTNKHINKYNNKFLEINNSLLTNPTKLQEKQFKVKKNDKGKISRYNR